MLVDIAYRLPGDQPRLTPKPRPRILTVIHSFDPGGVERVAMRLHAQWRRMGIDATLVVGRESGSRPDFLASGDYVLLPSNGRASRRTQLGHMLRHLPAIIRTTQPDILFCPGNTYTSVAVAMKHLLGRECPPIVAKISNDLIRRDMPPPIRWGYYRWLRMQGRRIDAFVAMAPGMVPEITERLSVGRDRVTVIHDPALPAHDLDRFQSLPRSVTTVGRRFVAVGRLVPQKNFARLLDAFARIANPVDRLTILGEGPLRASLEAKVAALGIAAQVSMPGHHDDIASVFADSDCFCLSSDYEGVPAVVIEAMAAGLPIAATRCSQAMDELTGHGRFGTLVRVDDVAGLAAAMAVAATAVPNREAARAHCAQFTLESGANAYLALFEQLVAASAAQSYETSSVGSIPQRWVAST